MITVYHNPRCGKSRESLAYLDQKGVEYKVVKYMDDPLTPDELLEIVDALDMDAEDLVRKNEAEYKEKFKELEMTEEEWVLAMIEYPKLMQRPIISNGTKAVIGRPAENIDAVL
ncbi:MAG: arsenate reductase (glutaredoxin) [Schleiferiaceae bacterium]|jgi:arsenate reductase